VKHLRRRTGPRDRRLRFEWLEERIVLFSNAYSGEPNHETITNDGLAILNAAVLQRIKDANVLVDLSTLAGFAPGTSDHHFDNSQFIESVNVINSEYNLAVLVANPNAFDSVGATFFFGSLLHTVQDFYAHSNWVNYPELRMNALVENSDGYWNLTAPQGFLFMEGYFGPSFGIPQIDDFTGLPNGMVDVVFPPAPIPLKGIVSGTTTDIHGVPVPGNFDATSPIASISHDVLNKDSLAGGANPLLFHYAYDLAVQQTTHEFQRLCRLVGTRFGAPGVDNLIQQWVRPDAREIAVLQDADRAALHDKCERRFAAPRGALHADRA